MQNSEWLQVEAIFHKALSLDSERRAAYLGEVCLGRESLRGEVETLLAAYESRGSFMEQPVLEFGLEVLHHEERNPLAGRTVGPYTVIEAIGKGGMGEVYLAEDNRLGRKVALKFLSAEFVGDNWAKRQLIKEAQSAAMLDHPNICPVYGFEETDGLSFIVMQYVEGETLAALIANKRIQSTQILPLAQQIVSALVESHAHSIIHRDIKPKNIMVTPSGQVKVLDFGLAKTMQRRKILEQGTDSISHVSQTGMIQGTVAYMSPEQLRAEKLDFRSDIFSVGTVLYELISGKRPFARDSEAEVISAILSVPPPPLEKVERGNGQDLSAIVLKCLEKEKTRRYQSFSEVLYDLGNLYSENSTKATHAINFYWIAAAILVVLAVLAGIYFNTRTSRVYSLAVVPVSNNSNNPNLDYLEDALPTSLIAKLSRLSNLKVKTLTTLAHYQSDTADPFQIGKDFEVDAVLLGTIVNNGNGEVLQARLIDTRNRAEIWREQYPLTGATVLVQSRLSEKIASTLQLRLGVAERRFFERHETNSEDAYQEYLRGSHFWRFRDQENIRKAINHFKKAIDLDPAFARAHAGLSACYALLNTTAYGDMPTAEAMNRAQASAQMALTIDPSLPEAHTALGLVNLKYFWDWRESEKEFQIALSINSEDASAHYWYSNLLTIIGRQSEAMQEAERARQIDPLSLVTQMNFCRQYYYDRRFDEAAGCLKEILKEDPSSISAKHVLGYVYYQLGQHDDAIRSFQELPDTSKTLKVVSLGYVYGRVGRQREALKELEELKQIAERGYVPPQEFAVIYLGLGNTDQVFFWLDKAHKERFAALAYLTADPAFDPIKGDPRFDELVAQMNLSTRN
jgi:eukaryotic-like serine/threonine-protein kinase